MIRLQNICKTFDDAGGKVEALKNITLDIGDGEIYGIIGMSGAGKSTLVRCINMLERPTEGEVVIDGVEMSKLSPAELRKKRRDITMIFQGFNLLMQKNCLKNVCFPMEISGMPKDKAKTRAMELLELVGLPDKALAYPAQLSGGQQQRVAIARALATEPKVLLCDEATSALDPNTTHQILELIKDINKKTGITVVVITHQMSVVEEICTHVAILDNGEVVESGTVGSVFSSPKSNAAKRLVFPSGEDEEVSNPENEKRLRVVFNGAKAASAPLISQMAIDKGILVNIVAASTRSIGDSTYGSMLLGIPGGDEEVKAVKEYLESVANISAEEV